MAAVHVARVGEVLAPVAAAGLLPALTELMLARSLEQCRLWLDRGWELQVAVNLAAGSLDDLELPRRVETSALPPVSMPRRWASAGPMRSAPSPSRLRQPGSRMMVLAVNDRRSPADSRNGHAGSSPGGVSVASGS